MTLLEQERAQNKHTITTMNGDFLAASATIAHLLYGKHMVYMTRYLNEITFLFLPLDRPF